MVGGERVLLGGCFAVRSIRHHSRSAVFRMALGPGRRICENRFRNGPVSPNMYAMRVIGRYTRRVARTPLDFTGVGGYHFVSLLAPTDRDRLLMRMGLARDRRNCTVGTGIGKRRRTCLALDNRLYIDRWGDGGRLYDRAVSLS